MNFRFAFTPLTFCVLLDINASYCNFKHLNSIIGQTERKEECAEVGVISHFKPKQWYVITYNDVI